METSDYVRHARRKPPNKIIPPLTTEQVEYFWSRVEKAGPTDCWLWKAGKTPNGYGEAVFWIDGKRLKAFTHRLAYTLTNGPIPTSIEINHLGCKNRSCCNPAHLEAVPNHENILRVAKRRAGEPACMNNHPWTPDNTLITKRGFRQCRECNKMRLEKYRKTRLEELKAGKAKQIPESCRHGHTMNADRPNVLTDKYGDHFCKACAAERSSNHYASKQVTL